MDIVILANFTMDFTPSDNGRFSYLAQMLSRDHDVEIITSDFYHIKKQHLDHVGMELPYRVTFLHEPGYARNVSVKRFYSHYVWGKNVRDYLAARKKPDVLYCAVPSLDGPFNAAKYCAKNRVRFVIDIQDLWPEAFQMVLNVPVLSGLLFAPLKKQADYIYKSADAVCAVSDTYCKRALSVNHKCKSSTTVFLGTDLSVFDRYAEGKPVLDKKEGEIWIAYCGTLGSSYDLTCIIDALSILKDDRVSLIVMGDGPKQEEFKKHAADRKVKAVFTGRLPYDQMCALLKTCDINVNPIKHLAAQSIINKHADYAASGLPVVSTQENEEYRKLVETYGMGFNCNNNDAADLADKIRILISDEAMRESMGRAARKCAEERFDRAVTYRLLEKQILAVRSRKTRNKQRDKKA